MKKETNLVKVPRETMEEISDYLEGYKLLLQDMNQLNSLESRLYDVRQQLDEVSSACTEAEQNLSDINPSMIYPEQDEDEVKNLELTVDRLLRSQ